MKQLAATRGRFALVLWIGCVLIAAACRSRVAEMPRAMPDGASVGGNGAVAGASATSSAANAAAPADCDQVTLAPRRIWRLTATQYDNTIKDLLGTQSAFGAGFPADDVGVGFGNASDELLMTPLLADKLQSAAQTNASTADLTPFASCASASADDHCLREFVAGFGKRAFRRPLRSDEIDTYFALGKQAGAFDGGARTVISAMLQSPYFLYRFELGQPSQGSPGTYELDDYEIASELSYLLWQTMPDDALFEAAQRHELHDPKSVQAQADRMLQSERARPVVRQFVFDWLGLSTITTVPKDTTRYPELTDDIRASMVTEAERFVDHVMFGDSVEQDGSVRALLNADTTFIDDALASFYGVPGAASSAGVQLSNQQRRGILTLGGVLLTHSRSNDSSPIHRGKLVREKFLCQPLPPPPPGLILQPPGLDPTKTARQRYAEHSANSFCHNCHKLMDPIGLAFEHFDGTGRFRADDNGLPIDPSGEIVPNDNQTQPDSDADGPFADSGALIDLLANSQDVRRCYALEWFRFAYGEGKTERDGDGYPSCQAKRFEDAAITTGGSLQEIIHALINSDWFLARSGSADANVAAAQDAPSDAAAAPSMSAAMLPQATDAGVADMPLQPGLNMELTVDNDWGMGYCHTYQLKNTSSAPITWSIPLDVRGKMNNHWECNVTGDSGAVVFTGADHNKTIAPGSTAQFGFCAMVSSGS